MLSVAWAALLVAAPALPPSMAAALDAIGALVCHRRPARSFHLAGAQLPVCARCLGIYAGAAFGAVVTASRRVVGSPTVFFARSRRTTPRAALLIVGSPTIATALLEWGGVWDPGNLGRALAGVVLGAGVAAVVLTLHYDECVPRRPNARHRPPTHI